MVSLDALPRTRPIEQHHHVSERYHIHVEHHPDGWYLRCPQHHTPEGESFKSWDEAIRYAEQHLRTTNHF